MLRVSFLIDVIVPSALVVASLSASAADKPVVFNHVSGQRTLMDEAVHEHFEKTYAVVDFTDREHTYTYPKPSSGFGPTQPVYVDNRCLSGNVSVVYVITVAGTVTSAYALKFTDPALAKVAVQRMEARRFQPAQLDGKPVSTIAATQFAFPCPE
jgi:hypothetical protein